MTSNHSPEGRLGSLATAVPLIEALRQVPDFRRKQGRRYPLEAILALGVTASLCGYNSYGAMVEWGNNYGADLIEELGFTNGRTPSVGTFFAVFSRLDRRCFDRVLAQWNEQVLAALESLESPETSESGSGIKAEKGDVRGDEIAEGRLLHIDGKTLRGSKRAGAQIGAGAGSSSAAAIDTHLLSAVSQRLGLFLGQEAVSDKENEIPAMKRLLSELVIRGRVLSMDALLTQKEIAQQIVLKGGTT